MKPNAEEILEQKKSGVGFRARVCGSSGSVFLPARIEPDFRKIIFEDSFCYELTHIHYHIFQFTFLLENFPESLSLMTTKKKFSIDLGHLRGLIPENPLQARVRIRKNLPFNF